MTVDIEKLAARMKEEADRIERQKALLEEEIFRLNSETARMNEGFQAIAQLEGIAAELEALDRLDDSETSVEKATEWHGET